MHPTIRRCFNQCPDVIWPLYNPGCGHQRQLAFFIGYFPFSICKSPNSAAVGCSCLSGCRAMLCHHLNLIVLRSSHAGAILQCWRTPSFGKDFILPFAISSFCSRVQALPLSRHPSLPVWILLKYVAICATSLALSVLLSTLGSSPLSGVLHQPNERRPS